MKIESPFVFYPKLLAETIVKQAKWVSLYIHLRIIYKRVKRDPARFEYIDAALAPVTDHEEERELFRSEAAQGYLEKVHRIERVSRGEAA